VTDALAIASKLLPGDDWATLQPLALRGGVDSPASIDSAAHQTARVPPVKDVEIAVSNLPPGFDGHTIIQPTDLHISRFFPPRGHATSCLNRKPSASTSS